MENLNVTIVQSQLYWENVAENLKMFSEKIEKISADTDLIVLPEMFTTGFSMNAKNLAEKENGLSLKWMIGEAAKKECAITGSLIIRENGNFYNRLFFVFPNGDYKTYDKKHTFTLAKEHETYTAGNERLLLNFKGWKICPLVCYDLRFPVWARNTEDYDVLIYVANWPKTRISAWDTLLKARAIENMSYCIGVNRVGLDGNGYDYNGHSAIFDVLGEKISTSEENKECIETITLSKGHIKSNRDHLQFLRDRDNFNLT